VESIFFGTPEKQLYGVIQEPEGTSVRDFAVLVCYPFGQEYMISHRSLRTLCRNLARAGVPSLRFDYAGSGDSYDAEFLISSCVENVQQAIHELIDYSGLDTVKIVGLRLGAAVACLSCQLSNAVNSMVLWDPVLNGEEYFKQLTQDGSSIYLDQNMTWVNGFPISSNFKNQLHDLGINNIQCDRLESINVVLSQPNPDAERLLSNLNQNSSRINIGRADIDDVKSWVQVDYNASFILPQRVLSQIQDWLLQ